MVLFQLYHIMNMKHVYTLFHPLTSAIPYTFRISTGDGEDNGTNSNVWVKVHGPRKKHTGRLFLELAQNNYFRPGSTEIFSLEAVDVDEVKKLEVSVVCCHGNRMNCKVKVFCSKLLIEVLVFVLNEGMHVISP